MISLSERLISILFYIIPFSNIIHYGHYFYTDFPLAEIIRFAIFPIIYIQSKIFFNDLLVFIILFIGIVKNRKIAYFIRFNAMQVILLKLILLIIKYIYLFIINLKVHYFVQESIETSIFVVILTLIIFSMIQSLRGIEADLPLISEAAKMQI